MSVLEMLKNRFAKRKATAKEFVEEAVKLVAQSRKVDVDELMKCLDELGITYEQFEARVILAKTRLLHDAVVQAASRNQERLHQVDVAIDAARTELDRAEAVYEQATRPLFAERNAIRQGELDAQDARRQLRNSADRAHPELWARITQLYREGEVLSARKVACQRRMPQDTEAELQRALDDAKANGTNPAFSIDLIKTRKAEADGLKKEIAEIDKRISVIQAECDQIEPKLLEP